MTGKKEWNAERLLQVSGSYWNSCALHAAVELDVFSAVGEYELTAEEIADALGTDVRGTKMLLTALTAMELLRKEGERYANTAAAKSYLNKGSEKYVGYMIRHHHHLVEKWSRLDEAVKTGRPTGKEKDISEDERKSFLMGMFNLAAAIAPELAKQLDLSGKEHLLDLGGGPGTFSIYFCLHNPGLNATVFDLETTRPFAEKTVSRFNLSDRVEFLGGDYVAGPIPGSYDVAWLSQILHGESPEVCRSIVQKAVSTLVPGGLILIHEFILNNNLEGPLFPALFSLNMLVNTEEGKSYTEKEIKDMMDRAGVRDIHRLDFQGPNQSGIIAGIA